MLVLLGIAAFLVGAMLFVGAAMVWYSMAEQEYREPFKVICPETLQPVQISVNGTLAARTRFVGREKLEVTACSRWPERSECDQSCVPQVPFLGDSRCLTNIAAFLRINNPVQMTRELYDRIQEQLRRQRKEKKIA